MRHPSTNTTGSVEVSEGDSGIPDIWRKDKRRGDGDDGDDDAANTQVTNSARRLASTEHYEHVGEPFQTGVGGIKGLPSK